MRAGNLERWLEYAVFAVLAIAGSGCAQEAAAVEPKLAIYAEPAAITYKKHNNDFTVRVRTPEGPWRDLYEYNVKVDLNAPQNASMVYFDMTGPVEVSVRKTNGTVHEVRVRPSSAGIKAKLAGSIATFTLTEPRKLSVEFDGDRLHNLHILASPLETDRPDPSDPNVVWFGPGVHQPEDGSDAYHIASNKTVYIAGGAVVRGRLVLDHVENVKILGRGIIDEPEEGIEIRHSKAITIEGPIVVNPRHYTVSCGQSSDITIRNLKTFSASPWSDGLDFMSCSQVRVDDVFLRTSDDCIAIYGHRWDFRGDARDYLITHSILWADVAHPINIGLHGDPSEHGETLENIRFQDIDILEHVEHDPDYRGAMAISDGDDNLVRNIVFDSIRVDDFQEGELVNLRVVFNQKYNTAPGRGIENILFRNVTYSGVNQYVSVISGYDAARTVRGIRFEHLIINGRKIDSARAANIDIGEHVSDVTFRP
jgi:Glycosyl hydrolases family 28